jgi:DNA-cytosine methyltransferase
MFTVGSLFSGIGGIDLGLERAGFSIIWQVEINEYRQQILRKRFPDALRYGDISTVGRHNLTPVDLVCGGFPCQPHSLAGRRRGSADERNLWPQFYRVVCELRPGWILVENVPGLLSSDDGRFFGGILRDLASLGYDAEWQVLPAAAFGAPHLRERVFLVAYSNSTEWRPQPQRWDDINRNNARWKEAAGRPTALRSNGREGYVAYPARPNGTSRGDRGGNTSLRKVFVNEFDDSSKVIPNPARQGLAEWQVFGKDAAKELAAFKRSCSTGAGQWAVEPELDRVAHGVPRRVERLGAIGDSVVPQCAEFVGRCIMTYAERRKELWTA